MDLNQKGFIKGAIASLLLFFFIGASSSYREVGRFVPMDSNSIDDNLTILDTKTGKIHTIREDHYFTLDFPNCKTTRTTRKFIVDDQ